MENKYFDIPFKHCSNFGYLCQCPYLRLQESNLGHITCSGRVVVFVTRESDTRED